MNVFTSVVVEKGGLHNQVMLDYKILPKSEVLDNFGVSVVHNLSYLLYHNIIDILSELGNKAYTYGDIAAMK